MARYGKAYPEVMNYVASCKDLSTNAYRLFIWLSQFIYDGNKVKGERESRALREWRDENYPGTDLNDVRVVQFGYDQAAMLFNGWKSQVQNAVKELIGAGILERVGTPRKGHAGLYVVCPKGTSHRVVPNESKIGTSHRVVPNGGNGYKNGAEWVQKPHGIGTQADAVTCGDESYQEHIKNNNQESGAIVSDVGTAEKSPLVCPECKSAENVKVFNDAAACACGFGWPLRRVSA